MTSLPQEIIRLKRRCETLSESSIKEFFEGFLNGKVADYQMGAMLMAIAIRGMHESETIALTKTMRESGKEFRWPYPRHLVVDKHSTGGVGDKTSLVILPLCLLEGLKVPMMAGRGLGHTGGTLDKLEAIGWDVYPTAEKVQRQMDSLGGVIMGQTDELVPLDRRLYAMRDVTATVDSIPLIVASILSKKLAEGIGGLVMDVKFGSGAFMSSFADAKELAIALASVGRHSGLKVRCLLTDMNSPLGSTAGNALEIVEVIHILNGQGPEDTKTLSVELAAEMIHLAHPNQNISRIRERLFGYLNDGSAWKKFLEVAKYQGGNLHVLHNPGELEKARIQEPLFFPEGEGSYIEAVDVRKLGLAVVALGGGRALVNDVVDPYVGLSGLMRVGSELPKGMPVCMIHANDPKRLEIAKSLLSSAFQFTKTKPSSDLPLIREIL